MTEQKAGYSLIEDPPPRWRANKEVVETGEEEKPVKKC